MNIYFLFFNAKNAYFKVLINIKEFGHEISHQSCDFIFALFKLLFFVSVTEYISIFIGHISVCQWMVRQQEILACLHQDFIFLS